MKKIKVYEDAAILYDDSIEKEGISITANKKHIKDVDGNEKNHKKYIKKDAIIKPKEE